MATKVLRVQLADILGAVGPAGGATGEVSARYVDASGGVLIRYTDGTLVLPLPRRKAIPASGIVDFTVVPNDDATILAADQGFGIEVSWDVKVRGGHESSQRVQGSAVVAVTSAASSPALLGTLAMFTPPQQGPWSGGGYIDHGNQSGSVSYSGAIGSHALTMTAATAITLTGGVNGATTSIWATGAFPLVVQGVVVSTGECVAAYVRGAWKVRVIGGAGVADTVAPGQPGIVSVTPTDDGYTISWGAATDDIAVAGYEVQLDGGAWVDSGSDLTHTFTGLTAGTSHSGAVRAYDVGNNRGASRAWGPSSVNPSSVPPVAGYTTFYDSLTPGGITLASGKVAQWADRSGNGKHMVQADTAKQPVVATVAGKAVIDFGATTSLVASAVPQGGTLDGTLIVVAGYRTGGPATNIKWIDWRNRAGTGIYEAWLRPTNIHFNSIVNNGADTVIAAPAVDVPHFLAIATDMEETAAGTTVSYVDATTGGTSSSVGQGQFVTAAGTPGDLILNGDAGTTVFMLAVLTYPTKLSPTDIAAIRAWAQTRYGTP